MMKCMDELLENISEELEDSHKYIDMAFEQSGKNPELAKLYVQLSAQELGHAEMLQAHLHQYSEAHKSTMPEGVEWACERERRHHNASIARIKEKHEAFAKMQK